MNPARFALPVAAALAATLMSGAASAQVSENFRMFAFLVMLYANSSSILFAVTPAELAIRFRSLRCAR